MQLEQGMMEEPMMVLKVWQKLALVGLALALKYVKPLQREEFSQIV